MNVQEIFNKVVTHLAQQGVRSIGGEKDMGVATSAKCAYRGSNGTSCAIGCLILDQFYYPDMEGEAASSCNVRKALVSSGVLESVNPKERPVLIIEFLGALQVIHDGYRPHKWKEAFTVLAKNYKLQMPEVDWSKCNTVSTND